MPDHSGGHDATSTLLLSMVTPTILIWGINFAVMRIGVNEVGPFTLAAMRFTISSLPFLMFFKRPAVPWTFVVFYALTFGLGQFGLLLVGIKLGLPSGLASLLAQLQVVFTPILAWIFLRQRIPGPTLLAILISLAGLGFVFAAQGAAQVKDGFGTAPILLGVAAALFWSVSNVAIAVGASKGYSYHPISLIVWASLLLPIPFVSMGLAFGEFTHISLPHLLSALLPALYLGGIATVVAYYFWVRALSVFPASKVTPFSLLIPIIGLGVGSVLFGETLVAKEVIGCGLVISGIVVHAFGLRPAVSKIHPESTPP